MTASLDRTPPHVYARAAGLCYLVIIAAGLFAEFGVRGRLVVPGDAAATWTNLSAAPAAFRVGTAADLVMLLCDVGVALALYQLLRPVHRGLASLAAGFRLVHAAVLGANLLNLGQVAHLAGDAAAAAALGPGGAAALVQRLLASHSYGYAVGLVFFGGSCAALGVLAWRTRVMPRALGALLVVAAAAYLTDGFAHTLLMNYAELAAGFLGLVLAPALAAELWLCLWLLFRGGRRARPA